MQSDRWIEKGDFRSKTKSCILPQSKKCLFDPNFFDRAIQSAHPVEKVDFFNGMRGSDCQMEKLFEAHRISHHPTKHTITPYNSSDAGLTATILMLLLPATTRCGTSCSQPASSAYRHPMAVVRVIDDLFATPLLLLPCSLWRLSTKSNTTTAAVKRMKTLRTPNERFARGKSAMNTCA